MSSLPHGAVERPCTSQATPVAWLLRRHRSATLFLGLLLAGYHAFAIWSFALTKIGGRWYSLAEDDVMISLRYARNLAAGDGLVLNAGERVEGFTNPLLTFLGAGLHLAHVPPPFIPLALHLINLGLSLCILVMLTRFWGERSAGKLAGLVAGALYVLGPQHLYFAAAGFEVYMQAAILLYCVWRSKEGGWGRALLLGLLPLTHGTSQVGWLVLCGALVFGRRRTWHLRLAWLGVALAPAVAYEVFRLAYYGEALPNTYYLKVGHYPLTKGPLYVIAWAATVVPLLALGAPAVLLVARSAARCAVLDLPSLWRTPSLTPSAKVSGRSVIVVTVLVAHVAAVTALGGDFFPQSRLLFPCTVLLAVMAGRGAVLALTRPRRPGNLLAAAAIVVGVSSFGELCVNYLLFRGDFEQHRRFGVENVAVGLALQANTRPDAVVALTALGAIGYYCERPLIDMLGKADWHIARTNAHPRRQIAHNKSDFSYVLSRAPDFVELRRTPEQLEDLRVLTDRSLRHPHGWMDELALHPVFRASYMPHQVHDERGRSIPIYSLSPDASAGWQVAEDYFASAVPR